MEAAILRGVAKVEAIWNAIAVECQIARAVVAQVFGGLEPRNAQAEGGC